ncbi:MAG: hypothetical protein EB127_28705 [Alphaproteobacteria bacterium]|nr:hypothetical protein [Alphaproteobacteria bacterium]
MSKYYIKCGSLQLIYSTSKSESEAAAQVLWETNKHDVLDEYFYIDERGYRDYTSADKLTQVIPTEVVMKLANWEIE